MWSGMEDSKRVGEETAQLNGGIRFLLSFDLATETLYE